MEAQEIKTEPTVASESKEMKEWEIKHAAEILMEAEEIEADPVKMKAIKAYLEKSRGKMDSILKEVGSIDELKEIRKQKTAKSEEK